MADKPEKDSSAKIYEAGFLLLPTLNEEKATEVFAQLKKGIISAEVSIISEETPKMRVLSYEIFKDSTEGRNGFDRAYFGWIKFEGESDRVAQVKKILADNPDVLRYLVVKTVRENFVFHLTTVKTPEIKTRVPKAETKPSAPPTQASIEEIDKSIEELVKE